MATQQRPRETPVVTGIGVVAPTGLSIEEHWQAVLAGKSGIVPLDERCGPDYQVRLGGLVPGFDATAHLPGRLLPQTDRWTHLALYAAAQALDDAGVRPQDLPEYEMAVVTSSSSGGTEFGQREMQRLYSEGPSWVSAYQSIAWFYAATTGQISIRYGMRGPCDVLCCEQAGGLDAIGQARRLLRDGTRLVVTGGTDAAFSPYSLVAQLTNGQISRAERAEEAYLPFDERASGYLPGEGGAILVTEAAGTARARDAGDGYGAILGYAAGFDRSRHGRPPVLARVLRRALDDARCRAEQVDVVFADAVADPVQDRVEAEAITEVFGPRGVPVTAPKTLTGRLYGGGAALDVAGALMAMRDGVVPHVAAPVRMAPDYDIDLVLGEPRQRAVRTAVVIARGHGGFTAALVLGARAPEHG
ncbi:ketosynthase chain-length factor [Dactylosporangium fulvum]|uniref:Ketosynthase chain-length factor n=1 Tax=Dactylosporangium fulvum TaxID=53359 RepID=A0ABY5WAG3_9ACTN|nr:ketosynthase chain-length factor [Dactylosporangium fulvum]UWP86101.1 ketosynthase chain-length factor [Dactylosporangium fulvum]